jgi:hypothetical protein
MKANNNKFLTASGLPKMEVCHNVLEAPNVVELFQRWRGESSSKTSNPLV